MQGINNRLKAQSILEYAIVVACLAAALGATQIYIKRAIQGRLRNATDEIGQQYAPENITAEFTTTINSDMKIKSELKDLGIKDKDGIEVRGIESTIDFTENTQRSGSEELGEFEDKLF